MELTVPKRDLLRLATRMQGVAERKSTMPALSNVLLTIDGPNTLRVAATDMYLALVGRIAVDVVKGGSVAVSARDLLDRVRMMPDGPIRIVVRDGSMTLKAAGTSRRYTLRGMSGDDYPVLPVPNPTATSLSLGVDVLQDLIARTYLSISTDETRAHLNSSLFEWDGEIVRMVTTDGHRLSKMEVTVSGRQASAVMLIPLKAILELRRLCEDIQNAETSTLGETASHGFIDISQGGANAFFTGGGMTFAVRLVDAQFPPYAQVIPQHNEKVLRVARTAFADALRAVSIAANERTGGVRLILGEGKVAIATESPDSGDGFDEVPVDYSGAPMTVGFNAKYFLDVLGVMKDDEVEIGLGGELDPAVIRPVGRSDFLAVVMPMRI
ncbi:MAG: DNA polymerase III subunit beta [Polyangiaceae bacterium]|jgi:DNA polymerase-3 subunit beta